MPRVLFFDWTVGGHHALYLERLATAASSRFTPLVAAPSPTLRSLKPTGLEVVDLGPPPPAHDAARHLSRDTRKLHRYELALFRETLDTVRPDVAFHAFADGLLRNLAFGPRLSSPTAILLFRPRAHYQSQFHTALSARERLFAGVYERLLTRWRGRPDAQAALTLDEVAAESWRAGRGAPAAWLPEPPVLVPRPPTLERGAAALFGSLGPRKGLHRLAAAARTRGDDLSLVLAGSVVPGFEAELNEIAETIRASGVPLDLRPYWHDEQSAIDLLASVRCVVLPYVDHYGMSRVLLEAAYAGTPVVAARHGLIGHLVDRHDIGITANTSDPLELRRSIDTLCHDRETWQRCHLNTARFAERYSPARFSSALLGALAF